MPSGITKNSAGAAQPTVGISDRNDYCAEEIDVRVTEWMEDLTNNDGVMKSYVDIAKDKEDFTSAYDNFVAKKASVLSTSYNFLPEFLRLKNFLKPYRTAFWDEEALVNAELKRLETIKAQYDSEVVTLQNQIDALDPSDPNYSTDLALYTGKRNTQSSRSSTTENYRADVKTDADAIFGQFNGTSNTGQIAEAVSGVNKEIEDILEAIFFAIVRSCQLIGTKPAVEDVFGTTIGSTETNTPVALLSYFDKFTKLIESKDTVNALDGYTFDLTPFQNVSDNIVGLDIGEGTATYKDINGNDAIATYPVLNAAPDAKIGLLTAYLNSGVSAYYFGDDQPTLSNMTTQVLNAKNAVETQLGNLQDLPVANQATDWNTDLDNLETARTQYSSWTFTSEL